MRRTSSTSSLITCDLASQQRHFLAALMIATGQGITVGTTRRLQRAHADVRNSLGAPITESVWNTVAGVLVMVLGELGAPPAALVELVTTLDPIRVALVSPEIQVQ